MHNNETDLNRRSLLRALAATGLLTGLDALLVQRFDLALVEIGKLFGGRDHSTVIHAISTVEERMQTTAKHKRMVDELYQKIEMATL
jgi:hypothetical protein